MREGGADVLDPEHVDEELRQLEHPLRAPRSRRNARRRPTARRPFESANTRSKRSASAIAVVGVAGVAVHLPAAGLRLREVDLDPEALEQLHHRAPRAREQRVVEAGDEERDPHVAGA